VNPRILGAVVFHSLGPVYDYSLCLNHSWAPSGFPDVKSIMDTKGSGVNDLYLGLNLIPQMQYSLSGFLTVSPQGPLHTWACFEIVWCNPQSVGGKCCVDPTLA
jgi:hypothetical protein